MTIAELERETTEYLQLHEGMPNEFDQSINGISRKKIDAMKNQYGSAFLGKVTRYAEDKGKPYLCEYLGQKVFNFEYGFVIPEYDEELIRLIKEREFSPYEGTKKDAVLVARIMLRIERLNGVCLFWA